MKISSRIFAVAVVTCALMFSLTPTQAAVKPGDKCSKIGQMANAKNKKYTCIKKKGVLVWNAGVSITPKPSASPTLVANPLPSPSPTPTEAIKPSIPNGFTSNSALGAIEVSWAGTYIDNPNWVGFKWIQIYASLIPDPSESQISEAGVMTGNLMSNRIVVAGYPTCQVVYIHARAIGEGTPLVKGELAKNVTSAKVGSALGCR